MKMLMLKQKIQTIYRFRLFAVVAALLVVATPIVYADTFSDQINNLQQQNSQNQIQVDQLAAQSSSYTDAINRLDAQINSLQQQIVANQNKQIDLQNQITQAQADLDQQKKVLGENIKAMYLEGDISALEVLAASKNLSEYVDKQQNRNAVQANVAETLAKVNDLKQQLLAQKNAIDSLLTQQEGIRNQLASDSSKQEQMLAYTEGQKNAYANQIQANKTKIAALVAQQLRANSSTTGGYYFLRFPGSVAPHDPAVNDYPFADSGFSMSLGWGCPEGQDNWGYCTRQCVSYAAWAVERSGRTAPDYYGNAKDWVSHARSDGIPVYTSDPQPGDVAISTAGNWGHAMYVEAVSGNKIFVSEYNNFLTGQYYTEWRTYL